MKLKTTNELVQDLGDKHAFHFAWSMLWRMWVIGAAIGAAYGFLEVFFEM